MTTLRLEEMTWEEVDRLDRERTIVMLPISPIEEHGPHLPLGTDLFGAHDMAEEALKLLEAREPSLAYLLVPAVPLGSTDLAKEFPGTLHLRGQTLYLVMRDLLESLARTGFRYVVVANHHPDLTHIKAIDVAANEVMEHHSIRIVEPASRHVHARDSHPVVRIGGKEVDPSTDTHAGACETSFIAYRHPALLRECARGLPLVLIDVGKHARQRAQRGEQGFPGLVELGACRGYIGSPQLADVEYGEAHLREGAEVLADAALRLWRGKPLQEMSERMRLVLRDFVRLN